MNFKNSTLFAFTGTLAFLAGAPNAQAIDWFWDADADTTVTTGGTGNWTIAGALWRNGSTIGNLTAYNDAAGPQNDTAANLILGGADGATLTLDAATAYNFNKITASNTYTLATNTAVGTFVGTTPDVNVASGKTLNWGIDLSAASSTVTKTGAGIWKFNNTGGQITSNTTTLNVQAGTLQFDTAGATANLATGTGAIVQSGGAGTAVSLVQTYNGGVVSARNYTLGSQLNLNGSTLNGGASNGALFIRLTSGTSIALTGTNTIAQSSGNFSQNFTVESAVTGTGTLNLNRANSNTRILNVKGNMSGYSGNVVVGASTSTTGYVVLGNSTGWGTGSLTLTGAGSNVLLGDEAATAYHANWTGGSALSFTSGTLATSQAVTVGAGSRLLIANGGANSVLFEAQNGLTVNGGTLGFGAAGNVAAAGTTTGTGGFVPYLNSTWTFGGSAASTISGNVRLNYSGSTLQVADSVAGSATDTLVSGSILGANGFTKSGAGTLETTGTNSYSGTTTVSSGVLRINGNSSAATGQVDVAAGATVGGTGSHGGALNVTGTLAPGASIESFSSGALTFNDTSTFAVEVDSSVALSGASDLQVVNGNLALNGLVNLTLADLAAVDVAFANNTVLSLLNYTGTWNNGVFTFNGNQLDNGEEFTDGVNLWRIDYNAGTGGTNFIGDQVAGNFVNLTAVPEPSVALLGGLGALALVLRRRRKA